MAVTVANPYADQAAIEARKKKMLAALQPQIQEGVQAATSRIGSPYATGKTGASLMREVYNPATKALADYEIGEQEKATAFEAQRPTMESALESAALAREYVPKTFAEQQRQYDVGEAFKQKTFGEQQRQYDVGFGEQQRQYDLGEALRQKTFGEQQRQYDVGFGEQQRQYDLGEALRQKTFGEQKRQYDVGFGEQQRQYDLGEALRQKTFGEQQRQYNVGAYGTEAPIAGAPTLEGQRFTEQKRQADIDQKMREALEFGTPYGTGDWQTKPANIPDSQWQDMSEKQKKEAAGYKEFKPTQQKEQEELNATLINEGWTNPTIAALDEAAGHSRAVSVELGHLNPDIAGYDGTRADLVAQKWPNSQLAKWRKYGIGGS